MVDGANGLNGRHERWRAGNDALDGIDPDEDLEGLEGFDEDEIAALRGEGDEAGRETRPTGEDEPEPEPHWLYPAWEYAAALADPLRTHDHGVGGNGFGSPDTIVRARRTLEPVQAALRAAGFYAYGAFDDQNRWTVAADDEAGRIDVRVEPAGLLLALWTSSPGLYADVENPWRRRRMEQSVRGALTRVARGLLAPHQLAAWDEVDQGVAVGLRYLIPFERAEEMGQIVRARLPELLDLLETVERRLSD